MNQVAARMNRLDIAAPKDRCAQELEIPQQHVRIHALADVKRVLALHARSGEQREGARKPVLVNRRRSGRPEQGFDVEPRLRVHDERGLSELHRQVVLRGQHG